MRKKNREFLVVSKSDPYPAGLGQRDFVDGSSSSTVGGSPLSWILHKTRRKRGKHQEKVFSPP